jgi:DNA-binding NarL/FixJ family response regulator
MKLNIEKIKVLIADQHKIFRESLKTLLETLPTFEVVGFAGNGIEAIEETERLKPHVVLMEISLPVMDGLDATRMILGRFPEVKVIILSMLEREEFISQMLEAGVSGYLSKDINSEDLFSALKSVYKGDTYLSPSVSRKVIDGYLKAERKGAKDLSKREKEIVKLLAQGKSKREIGDLLYISPRTVDTHRTNILKKLNLKNTPDLVRYAIQRGLVVEA